MQTSISQLLKAHQRFRKAYLQKKSLCLKYLKRLDAGEMISGFVPSQLKEARLLANFRFY